jgi:hypothetical protein
LPTDFFSCVSLCERVRNLRFDDALIVERLVDWMMSGIRKTAPERKDPGRTNG